MSSLLAFNFEMRAVPSKDVASFLKRGSNEAIRMKYHGWSEQESIGFGLAAHHDNGDDRPQPNSNHLPTKCLNANSMPS